VREPDKFFYAPDSRKMQEPFAAAFCLNDPLSQRLHREVYANLSVIFEAIGNRFGHAVNPNRHAINSGINHTLCWCFAREPGEAQLVTHSRGLSRSGMNGHPDDISLGRKNAVEPEDRFKGDNSVGHTLRCEADSMFQVEGAIRGYIQSPADFGEDPAVHRSSKYLLVDSTPPQLG
jgi:hypothetical protein